MGDTKGSQRIERTPRYNKTPVSSCSKVIQTSFPINFEPGEFGKPSVRIQLLKLVGDGQFQHVKGRSRRIHC